jgi:hypothetical protein
MAPSGMSLIAVNMTSSSSPQQQPHSNSKTRCFHDATGKFSLPESGITMAGLAPS